MKNSTQTVGLLVLFAFGSGCGSRNEYAAPPPPKVTVATPLLRPVQEYFETTGQTRAVQEVVLRARVGGYLKEIKFKDGQLVEQGDELFVIDQDTYAAEVASKQANLSKANAELHLADQQLTRTLKLAKEDAATESSLDIHQGERDAKAAEVDIAKAALRESQLNLDYTVIRAPFAGRAGRHLVDLGNLIIAGETQLVELESVDPIQAYFTLSEVDLLQFMEMMKEGKLKIISEADPIKLDLALGDSGDFRFHGHLDYRQFGINPNTGTTERRALFPNDPAELLPGLFVRLRAKVGSPDPQLLVDDQAIGRDQRGDYLLVVNKDNEVETRLVKLGILDNGLRVILTGIQESEHVVINGLQRARPGSKVDPKLVPMDARIKSASAKVESADVSPEESLTEEEQAKEKKPADNPPAEDSVK